MAEETHGNSLGVAGTVLGSIGTAGALGLFSGGLGGLLGGNNNSNQQMVLEMAQKDATISQLRSEQSTDAKLAEVYKALAAADKNLSAQIASMNVANATLAAQVGYLQNTVGQVIVPSVPNSVLNPGYGTAVVKPPASS